MVKWNASSRAAPSTMKSARRTSAITIPIERSRPWRSSGTAKLAKISAKTKMLSIERLRSIR